MAKNKIVWLTVCVIAAGLIKLLVGGAMNQSGDVPGSLPVENETLNEPESKIRAESQKSQRKEAVFLDEAPEETDINQKIVEEYQHRYIEINKKLEEMEFDFRGMLNELRRRLNAAEDGKLERHEILELFPPEIAGEYGEMLDLLSELEADEP